MLLASLPGDVLATEPLNHHIPPTPRLNASLEVLCAGTLWAAHEPCEQVMGDNGFGLVRDIKSLSSDWLSALGMPPGVRARARLE